MTERRLLLSLSFVSALFGCHAAPPPAAPSATARAAAAAPRVEWCADYRISAAGPQCSRLASDEERSHRSRVGRFEYQGKHVVRRTRVNPRGGLDLDDDGCSEYRYRYEHDDLLEGVGYRPDGSVCDRTLYSEHATVAQHVDAWGRPAASRDRAFTEERMQRDSAGFVVKNRFFARDGSPIASAYGAFEVHIERDAQGNESRTCYFGQHGQPVLTSYGVHCVGYRRDTQGNELEERYFGVAGQPVENVRGVQRRTYEYDRFGNPMKRLVLRADGTPVAADTGDCPELHYHYDDHGFHVGSDCLDGSGHGARWREGNASWRSTPDDTGRTRETRYFDPEGNPTLYGSARYARIEIDEDSLRHVTERRYFLANGARGQKRGAAVTRYEYNPQGLESKRSYFDASDEPTQYRGCASVTSEYDEFKQMVRRICRAEDGKPTLNWDRVAIEEWRYDAQGQLLEERDFDVDGKPAPRVDRVAREVFTHDASGTKTTTVHYAADGSIVPLPRFSFLSVRVAQPEAYWPPRTREASLTVIEAARAQLLAGMPFVEALYRYNDDELNELEPGELGYDDPVRMYSSARTAVLGLKVGEYSQVIEVPYGFLLYLRTE